MNDGVVNYPSARSDPSGRFIDYPVKVSSRSKKDLVDSVSAKHAPSRGVYHFLEGVRGDDHGTMLGVVDLKTGRRSLFYDNIVDVLFALPSVE
jgi:hypothetical protein